MTKEYDITFNVDATLIIHNDDIIKRVLDNHDDEGIPQPDIKGGTGWKNVFYRLESEEEVIDMLVYNLIYNGSRLSQLDGWGDCDDDDIELKHINTTTDVWKSK